MQWWLKTERKGRYRTLRLMDDEGDLEPLLDQIRELGDLDLVRLLAYVAAEVSQRTAAVREEEARRVAAEAEDLASAPWRNPRRRRSKGKGKGKGGSQSRDGPY